MPSGFDNGNAVFQGLVGPRADYFDPPPNDLSGFPTDPLGTLLPFVPLLAQGAGSEEVCQATGMTGSVTVLPDGPGLGLSIPEPATAGTDHGAHKCELEQGQRVDVQVGAEVEHAGQARGMGDVGHERRSLNSVEATDELHPEGHERHRIARGDAGMGIARGDAIEGIPGNVLRPREAWSDPAAYDAAAAKLTAMFRDNFKTYEDGVSAEVRAAEPAV